MFRIVSLSVLLTLIVVLGITFFRVVAPFLLPLFLAGVVAILAQPLFRYFVGRTNGRVRLASGLTTATVVSAILVPLSVAVAIASMQLYTVALDVSRSHRWDDAFGSVPDAAGDRTDATLQWVADVINDARGTDEPLLKPETKEEPEPVDGPDAAGPEDDSSASETESPSSEPVAGVEVDTGANAETPQAAVVVTNGEPPAPAVMPAATVPLPGVTEMVVAGPDADATVVTAAPESLEVIRSGRKLTPEDLKLFLRQQLGEFLTDLGDRSVGFVAGVFVSIVSAVVSLLIFSVALYYFFADGTALLASVERMVPVHVKYQRELLDQFATVVRSVVSATFLAAVGQAVATTFALWLLGFNHLLTLFVLSLLSAMIPMLGTWLVWGPCVVVLVFADRTGSAVFLAIYGIAVVGMLDNVIRTYVLNSGAKLHPLLALISVLGGMQVMGLWGVFIGPIVASCLHGLVKIFNLELLQLSTSQLRRQADQSASGQPGVASDTSAELAQLFDAENAANDASVAAPTNGPPMAATPTVPTKPPTPQRTAGKSRKRSRKR